MTPFKSPRVAANSPSAPSKEAGPPSRSKGSTAPPSRPSQVTLPVGGDVVRLPTTLEQTFQLALESAMSVLLTPAGTYVQTNQLTAEGALSRSITAMNARSLNEEGAMSASFTTVSAGDVQITVLATGTLPGLSSAEQTASIAPALGSLVLVFSVLDRRGAPLSCVEGISGAGYTSFTISTKQIVQTSAFLSVAYAQSTASSGSGPLTISETTNGGVTQYVVLQVANVSTGGVNGSNAVALATNKTVFTGDTSQEILMPIPASTRNKVIGGVFLSTALSTVVPMNSSMNFLAFVKNGNNRLPLQTQWAHSSSTFIGWTWTTASAGGCVAVEVG